MTVLITCHNGTEELPYMQTTLRSVDHTPFSALCTVLTINTGELVSTCTVKPVQWYVVTQSPCDYEW